LQGRLAAVQYCTGHVGWQQVPPNLKQPEQIKVVD